MGTYDEVTLGAIRLHNWVCSVLFIKSANICLPEQDKRSNNNSDTKTKPEAKDVSAGKLMHQIFPEPVIAQQRKSSHYLMYCRHHRCCLCARIGYDSLTHIPYMPEGCRAQVPRRSMRKVTRGLDLGICCGIRDWRCHCWLTRHLVCSFLSRGEYKTRMALKCRCNTGSLLCYYSIILRSARLSVQGVSQIVAILAYLAPRFVVFKGCAHTGTHSPSQLTNQPLPISTQIRRIEYGEKHTYQARPMLITGRKETCK